MSDQLRPFCSVEDRRLLHVPFLVNTLQLVIASRYSHATKAISLALPLLVFRIYADNSHHAFAVDHLALVAHFFY